MMQAAGASNDRSLTDRPRFRQDLFAELIEEQGARFIDVMDPDSGNLFRFFEAEYSLACGMDGERDIPGIVKWAQDELGMAATQHEVRVVIATLGDLGFIDTAGVAASASGAPGAVTDKPPVRAPAEIAPPAAAAGTQRRPSEPVEQVAAAPSSPAGRSPPRPTPRPTPAPVAPAMQSEVSIDLSDHIEVRPDDVKEAVRASKVMSAVEVPPDVLAALEAPRPAASKPPEPAPAPPRPVEARPEPRPEPRPAASKPPEPVPAPPRPVEARPEPRAEARPEPRAEVRPEPRVESRPEPRVEPAGAAGARDVAEPIKPVARPAEPPVAKPPVELPKPPVRVEKHPIAPPAPASRVSPVLIVLLILVVLGGIGFAVWKFVLNKDAGPTGATSVAPSPVPPQPAAPTPPPPAPAPTAKIALAAPAADDVKATRIGVVETILAEKPVKAGDVLVRLVGDRAIEGQLTALTREQKRLEDQLAEANQKLTAAQGAAKTTAEATVADRQRALSAKQDQVTAKKAELAALVITAGADGTFSPAIKNGQKVSEDDVLAKLQRDPAPTATFKVADAKPFTAGASVELTVGKGDQHVTCTVAEVQPDSVKVACPTDPALTDGVAVTLPLPSAGAAPAGGAGAAPAGGAGAAPAGGAGAAPAGGATAPAGGAAAAPAAGAPEAPGAGAATAPAGGAAVPAGGSAGPSGGSADPAAAAPAGSAAPSK
jgi:hypothetical protein